MKQTSAEERIERLNSLSRSHPVMPDEFIPWENKMTQEEVYMPQFLFSLDGTGLEKDLSEEQILLLKKLEVAQVLATYAWSEAVGCVIFSETLMKVTPTSAEGKYLVNMMTEELRHQYMFSRIVDILGVKPQPFTRLHRFLANLYIRAFRKGSKYIVVLAIEQVTDVYAKYFRKDDRVFSIVRKASELHHIEEGRHIAYQKICLEEFITKAGYLRRTILGIYYVLTIWFMRSQYVKKTFYKEAGVKDPGLYYRKAVKNYRRLFGKHCLGECVDYARSIGIVNGITKPFWRIILKTNI